VTGGKPREGKQRTEDGGQKTVNLMTRIVVAFLQGNLSVILILISLIAGVVALSVTSREEDPQIVVPIADIIVTMPGASAREVERQVATRLEKLLYQIDGVEYVYSTSYPSQAIVTVRFYVGEDRERSWVKLYNKINSNIDQVPPGVANWVIKPVEIDDVPIVDLTLYSSRLSDYELRRMAEELEIRLQGVKNAGKTYIVGGRQRQISLYLSPQRMAGRGIGIDAVARAVKAANLRNRRAGDLHPAALPDPKLSPSGHPAHRPAPLCNRHPAGFLGGSDGRRMG
jgi:multidrug efflux pump subunit AcrB